MRDTDWIHRALDGGRSAERAEPSVELEAYRETLELLETCRRPAPPDLTQRVMQALPDLPQRGFWSRWRARFTLGRSLWAAPLAGSLAAALLYVGATTWAPRVANDRVTVRFELHAPNAETVELVGTFNNWRSGDILLRGPDASGHWTATIPLPAGRHEYVFLVDGSQWLADPRAAALRPDGFGRMNALLEL